MTTTNLRRIPTGDLLKSKKTSFILYIKLQQMSFRNPNGIENYRYIPVSLINNTSLSKELKLSRPTIISRFRDLEELGLISYKEIDGQRYLILPNEGDFYVLVDIELIKLLLANCKEHFVKIYLLHKAYSTNYGEYYLTLEQIAEQIGLSKTHLQKIIDANKLLQKLGILQIIKEHKYENGQTRDKNKYKVLK